MDKKLKIGVVCYPTYGGSGVVATELGIALAKKGHHIHFISYKRPARLNIFSENIYLHEVTTANYPLFEYLPYETSLASKMVEVVEREKLDILHVHYAIPHAAVAYMAKQILETRGKSIPVITTLHGTDITLVGKNPAFEPVVEFSINQSDGVTAVSNHLKQETVDRFNISKDIKVIYNFIDFKRFRRVDKDHFKQAIAPNGEKIVAHTSNFRKVKRVDDVLRIFNEIHKTVPSRLLLIGDGPERSGLETLCRDLDCHDAVRFLGKQDAVEELLAISDLFLIPSQNESFGLAALEAMACEVPVISSNIGGLPEVIQHGVNGFLEDVGDVKAMAAHGVSLLTNETMHKQFRAASIARAKDFHIDSIVPVYEDYFCKLIECSAGVHA
jgi:N-acetyl-alpha-D-glucosaminyl L-malate synthase BshA